MIKPAPSSEKHEAPLSVLSRVRNWAGVNGWPMVGFDGSGPSEWKRRKQRKAQRAREALDSQRRGRSGGT